MRDAEVRSVPVSTGQHGHGLPAAEFATIQNYRAVILDGSGIHTVSMSRSRKVEIEAPAAVRTSFGRNWRSS